MYHSIAGYYDYIFPLKRNKLAYVIEGIDKKNPCKLLDIGSATGHFIGTLDKENPTVTAVGVDLDEGMISIAKETYPSVDFRVMDMLLLDSVFEENSFDIVTSFGNTLVHLNSREEIFSLLKSVRRVLRLGGSFYLQILNYQYIIEQSIKELPIIDNSVIRFERYYSEQVRDERLIFQTILTIKEENKKIDNEIYLYPIMKDNLGHMFNELGFSVNYYANFNRKPYHYDHLPLVMEVRLTSK